MLKNYFEGRNRIEKCIRSWNVSRSAVWKNRRVNPSLVIVCAQLLIQYGAGNCEKVSRMLSVSNIQQWHLVYIYIYIYFYYVGKICPEITPTNSCVKWEDCMKAWNYITIDFHQENKIVIRKYIPGIFQSSANNRESWPRKSDYVTLGKLYDNMLSHTRRKKLFRFSVCILHFVLTGIRGTNTVYFWLQLFAQHTQSTTKYLRGS